MELIWALFAIGALITVGLWDFIKKLVLSKWWDKDVFLFTCFLLYVPAFWINAYFQWTGVYDYETIKAACIIWVTNFWAPLWVMTALILSIYNIIGFFIGAFAIFLLSGFKFGQKIDLHPKWLIAVIIAICSISFWNSYYKYMIDTVQVHDYTALQFSVTGLCLFLYMLVRWKLKNFSKWEVSKILPYAAITLWLFMLFFLYLIPNMYLLWPLSLSYKMLSYSLVVPILLSVIFLWEPVNRTRVIAFGLTIISIFLFLI